MKLSDKISRPPNFIDRTNFKYGDRKVIEYAGHNGKHALWFVQCKCGKIDKISSSHINNSVNSNKGLRCRQCGNARQSIIQRQAQPTFHYLGQDIGLYIIIEQLAYKKQQNKLINCWRIKCKNCSKIRDVTINQLIGIRSRIYCNNCHNAPQGESGLKRLFYVYNKSAKGRHYDFNLAINEFKTLTSNNCHYCGLSPTQIMRCKIYNKINEWQTYIYNGIDRIDNTKGYILDNCVTCCKICNLAKGSMLYSEFIDYLNRICQYRLNNAIVCDRRM